MKNFIFKSIETDLQKIITIIASELNLLQKNILYITYRTDSILKVVNKLENDKGLQKQVDEYFEDDEETSPQTESDTKVLD